MTTVPLSPRHKLGIPAGESKLRPYGIAGLRGTARRRHARKPSPLCPPGLCRRGMENCGSGARQRHAGETVQARYLGARRSRCADAGRGWLGQSTVIQTIDAGDPGGISPDCPCIVPPKDQLAFHGILPPKINLTFSPPPPTSKSLSPASVARCAPIPPAANS